jgi:hypothetical protein
MRRDYFFLGIFVFAIGIVAIFSYGFQGSWIETESWQVTHYLMLDEGVWGDILENDTFPVNFNYDPLHTVSQEAPIGFKSSMEITVHKDTTIEFTIAADDGVIALLLDGEVLIHLEAPDPDREEGTIESLTAGTYALKLQYYQLIPVFEDDARAFFSVQIPGAEKAVLLRAGAIPLLLVGGLTTVLSFRREPRLPKKIFQKDVISVIYFFIYLYIAFYTFYLLFLVKI